MRVSSASEVFKKREKSVRNCVALTEGTSLLRIRTRHRLVVVDVVVDVVVVAAAAAALDPLERSKRGRELGGLGEADIRSTHTLTPTKVTIAGNYVSGKERVFQKTFCILWLIVAKVG